jgi:hypothetical protein
LGEQRFTRLGTRDMALTINYGVMNVAAFLATPVVDLLRLNTDDTVLLLPPYALLIAFTGLLQLPIFFAALFGLRDEYVDHATGDLRPFVAESSTHSLKQRVKGVTGQPNFWKALVLVVCLMGVKVGGEERRVGMRWGSSLTREGSAEQFPLL